MADAPTTFETEYVRDVLAAVEAVLGPSLPPDVHELFARTASVNAVKQSDRGTVSSSALFIAAVLWGRLEGEGAPAAVVLLAQAVGRGGFDTVFLSGMLVSDYRERLFRSGTPRATKRGRPVLSENLRAVLEELGSGSSHNAAGAGITIPAILVGLLSPPRGELAKRLAEARLDAATLAEAARPRPDPAKEVDPRPDPAAQTDGADPRPDPTAQADAAGPRPEPPAGATGSSTPLADDRPQQRRDKLGRGALAFAMAHLVCRIWADQQPKPGESRDAGAFIMHIDAPWGGGKTTFANFLAAILAQPDDPKARAALATDLGAEVAAESWPAVPVAARCRRWLMRLAGRLRLVADDVPARPPWVAATFNAWQNEHVLPSWWNFYLGVRAQLLQAFPFRFRAVEWVEEMIWRVGSRDTLIRVASLLVLVMALLALSHVVPALFADAAPGPQASQGTAPKGVLALLFLVLAGGSGIQLILSLRTGTEWLIRAAGQGGDPQVLGAGDPLRQFKDHFLGFCAALGRPILIVIDDLDRCQPAYVVDLMRGLMTVFNSPRVVYLILGDRVWLETCYAQAYAQMSAGRDPQTFGGHFAEKSLQLSFLLPRAPRDRLDGYLDGLLVGDAGIDAARRSEIEEAARAVALRQSTADRDAAVRSAMAKVDDIGDERLQAAAAQLVREAEVIGTALSPAATDEIKHHLQDLHDLMPSNPRQIKRVINMIALYQASALAVLGHKQGSEGWRRMALWVLLAGGYPALWRALDREPGLADRLRTGASGDEALPLVPDELAGVFDGRLPGDFKGVRLDATSIKELQKLMPRQ